MLKKEAANSTLVEPQKKYHPKNPKQVLVTEAVVDFKAEDLMPLNLLDSVRFQKHVHLLHPQYGLPSRKHLSNNLLIKKYDKLKAEIKSQLSSVKAINLTIDLWSNRQMRSFIGITGHYFSSEWKLQHIMLGCYQE